MKTTVEQLREILDPSMFEEQIAANDLTEGMADFLDGIKALRSPRDMKHGMNRIWRAYADIWTLEKNMALHNFLGPERFAAVNEHEDASVISHRILARIQETKQNLEPGVECQVDISDILGEAGIG